MRIAPFQFVKIRECLELPIGSMYGIYTNIGGILMVNVTIYIAYMDPMGYVNHPICGLKRGYKQKPESIHPISSYLIRLNVRPPQ